MANANGTVRFFFTLVVAGSLAVSAVDLTLQDGATGADVVLAVIAKLDSSNVFKVESDHRLLRRIAYVETRDGTKSNSSQRGGIWAIDNGKLDIVRTSAELQEKRSATRDKFGIEWSEMTWKDLRKPLYAGLVARLYLLYLESTSRVIPLAGDVRSQAQFWFDYYYSNVGNLTVEYFILEVKTLDTEEGMVANGPVW